MEENKVINSIMVSYHKRMIERLKDSINGCRHAIHIRDNHGNYYIKFTIDNGDGNPIDEVNYKLGTHPNNLKESDYKELITKLNDKEYARENGGVLQNVEG